MGASSGKATISSILATDTSDSIFQFRWQRIMEEAELYWPRNTSKHLARITGASERTIYRWLSGKTKPPAPAILGVLLAIKEEHVKRGKMFEQFDFDL